MRINKYLAQASGLSRRAADSAITAGRVKVNNIIASLGMEVNNKDIVLLDNRVLSLPLSNTTIILNKPIGYVCSRNGQGNPTIYDLLPAQYHTLKTVGRLDKDSSGILLLTNDGTLANQLTHPRFGKTKVYRVLLDKPLEQSSLKQLERGVPVEEYISHLHITENEGRRATVSISEGKNRQIRRTFEALHYRVLRLHRIQFGNLSLGSLESGHYLHLASEQAVNY